MSIEDSSMSPGAATLWMKLLKQGNPDQYVKNKLWLVPVEGANGSQLTQFFRHRKELTNFNLITPITRTGMVRINLDVFNPPLDKLYWADKYLSWNLKTATSDNLDTLFWSQEAALYGTLVRLWRDQGFPELFNVSYKRYSDARKEKGYSFISTNPYYTRLLRMEKRGLIAKRGFGVYELNPYILQKEF